MTRFGIEYPVPRKICVVQGVFCAVKRKILFFISDINVLEKPEIYDIIFKIFKHFIEAVEDGHWKKEIQKLQL